MLVASSREQLYPWWVRTQRGPATASLLAQIKEGWLGSRAADAVRCAQESPILCWASRGRDAVATPDYFEQVIVSGRGHVGRDRRGFGARFGIFRRPSVIGLIWASIDTLTAILACALAVELRVAISPGVHNIQAMYVLMHTTPPVLALYVGWFSACLIFLTRSYGLYTHIQHRSGLHEQRMTVQATLTAGLLLCGTLYLFRGVEISRLVVAFMVVFTGTMLCIRRAVWRRVVYRRYREGIETRNVMIVGAGRVGHALRNHLEALQHFGFRFKGFIALTDLEAATGDVDVVANLSDCLGVARSRFVDEIFFSVPAEKKVVVDLVEEARAIGIDVRVVPDLYDGLAWNAPVEYIGQFPTIPLHRREFPLGAFAMKRTLDLAIATLALLLLAPVALAIAIAVKCSSRGPVFYRAQRIGRKGRTFVCFKFRTMVEDAELLKADLEHRNERDSVLFKITDDPRLTRVGGWLRKYSLDELPQLLNVLHGDMSLVGPRPPVASEVKQYDLPHLRRLDVLPGITGLWQVEARQDPSFDSYISLDTAYVENWSLWLDLKILMRTIGVVLEGTGS